MTTIDYTHPTESALRAVDIHTLLPQQEPFLMVDRLVGFDEKSTATETLIRRNNIFVENDRFQEEGLIENIAQTCAARIGYVNKYIFKKDIQIGYIGAIRNLEISSTPRPGQLITTRMEVLATVFDMILASAEVVCDGKTIVTTEMKIAIAKEEQT